MDERNSSSEAGDNDNVNESGSEADEEESEAEEREEDVRQVRSAAQVHQRPDTDVAHGWKRMRRERISTSEEEAAEDVVVAGPASDNDADEGTEGDGASGEGEAGVDSAM